jgi:hypothetical protein
LVDHLFVHCLFTLCLWTRVKDWGAFRS